MAQSFEVLNSLPNFEWRTLKEVGLGWIALCGGVVALTGVAYGSKKVIDGFVEFAWGDAIRLKEVMEEKAIEIETIHSPSKTFLHDFRVKEGLRLAFANGTNTGDQIVDEQIGPDDPTPPMGLGYTSLEEPGRNPIIKPFPPEDGETPQ